MRVEFWSESLSIFNQFLKDYVHRNLCSESLVIFTDGLAHNLLVVLVGTGLWIKVYTGEISEVAAQFAVTKLRIASVRNESITVRSIAL